MTAATPIPKPVVLFDGKCVFCSNSIHFIIRRDRKDHHRFAPLQSEIGRELLVKHGLDPDNLDSIVLIDESGAHIKSSAVLRICRNLNRLWPLMFVFITVPSSVRDAAYDAIAKRRYRWWGKLDACMVPTPEVRAKFLSVSVPQPHNAPGS